MANRIIDEFVAVHSERIKEAGVDVFNSACDSLAGEFENRINGIPVVISARRTISDYRKPDPDIIDVEFERI